MKKEDFEGITKVISGDEILLIKNNGTGIRIYAHYDNITENSSIGIEIINFYQDEMKLNESIPDKKSDIIKKLDKIKKIEIELRTKLDELG